MDDRQAGGYSGSESYRYVEPILLDGARELLVISPYISMGYAKRLVALGKRKRVKVLTSIASQEVGKHITHHSRYLIYGYVKAIAILAVGALAAAYFSFYQIALLAVGLAGLVALVAFLMYSLSRRTDIEVRISYEKFVHEKAYISDKIAAVGSANLTYSGMRRNVERVEVITDPDRIGKLRAHFFELWRECR